MVPGQLGPVAGEQDIIPPYMPVPSPIPGPGGVVSPATDFPPMPPVPWTPGVVSPATDGNCPPAYTPWPPYTPGVTEPGAPVAPGFEEPPVQPGPTEIPGEEVGVEPGEALPGEPETQAVENDSLEAEQLPPALLLGTVEGIVSVMVANRPARPLTNQLVFLFNRATGERFQAYTDNSGFYSRRVPEGRYIIQIRQRLCAPFVRQHLARVQAARRTVANINVTCPAGVGGDVFSTNKENPPV